MNATITTKSGIVYTGLVLQQDPFIVQISLDGEDTVVTLDKSRIETMETDVANEEALFEALFEALADLEWDAKQAKNDANWTISPMDTKGMRDEQVVTLVASRNTRATATQDRLFAALARLSPEQMVRYGVWRAER